MKAWGRSDERVVGKNSELLFNTGRSEEHARDPDLAQRWQSRSSLGQGVGWPLVKKFHPPPSRKVSVRLESSTGRVIVASVGSGSQLPHTDVTIGCAARRCAQNPPPPPFWVTLEPPWAHVYNA